MTTPRPLTFTVPGKPEAQGSMRHVGRGRLIHNPKLVTWRQVVQHYAQRAATLNDWPAPYDKPVHVHATFWVPRPKRPRWKVPGTGQDLDKLVRAIGDALSPRDGFKVLTNDSRITKWHPEKVYADPGREGVTVTITPLGSDQL